MYVRFDRPAQVATNETPIARHMQHCIALLSHDTPRKQYTSIDRTVLLISTVRNSKRALNLIHLSTTTKKHTTITTTTLTSTRS